MASLRLMDRPWHDLAANSAAEKHTAHAGMHSDERSISKLANQQRSKAFPVVAVEGCPNKDGSQVTVDQVGERLEDVGCAPKETAR